MASAAAPYTMMNGLTLMMEPTMQCAPELLFNPRVAGLNKRSVVDLLLDSINSVESESVRNLLLQNIVVTGGPACTAGFCERLALEVQQRVPRGGAQVGVHASGNSSQIVVPWQGGSIVANSAACVGVSRNGYEDYGSRIIQEAFDWTASEMACTNLRSRRVDVQHDYNRQKQAPGPDNRQDLRQIFEDNCRSPRPSDDQLLQRIDTVATTPRGSDRFMVTKVSTHSTRNCEQLNLQHPSKTPADWTSGTLHQQGLDNMKAQEDAAARQIEVAAQVLGQRDDILAHYPVPRLPVDDAATSLLVAEERAKLGSERLFSPSAAALSPSGTSLITLNQSDSEGMPLARYLSAEPQKVSGAGRAPLDPRLYKESEADERMPRLPLSKLWTQGPTPAAAIEATSEIPSPLAPSAPPTYEPERLEPHNNWEQQRIAKMQARVTQLAARHSDPLDNVCNPTLENERRAFVPRSPALAQVVAEERQRQIPGPGPALRSGIQLERQLGREQGREVNAPTSVQQQGSLDSSVWREDAVEASPPVPRPDPEPVLPDVQEAKSSFTVEKTDRLYENFKERHTTDDHMTVKGAGRQSGGGSKEADHQRFMSGEMRRVEKIIDSIAEDDYEGYMAEQNARVSQMLTQPRTPGRPEPAQASSAQASSSPALEAVPGISVTKAQLIQEASVGMPVALSHGQAADESQAGQQAQADNKAEAKARLQQSDVAAQAASSRRAEAEQQRDTAVAAHRSDRAESAAAERQNQLRQQRVAASLDAASVEREAGESTSINSSRSASQQRSPRGLNEALSEERAAESSGAEMYKQYAQQVKAAGRAAFPTDGAEQPTEAQRAAEAQAQERAKAARLAQQQAEYEAEVQTKAAEREAAQAAVRAQKAQEKAAAQEAADKAAAEAAAKAQQQQAQWAEAQKQAATTRDQNKVAKPADATLAKSLAKVDAAMGNKPKRTPRTPREMRDARAAKKAGGLTDEQKRLNRERQNAELQAEQQQRSCAVASRAGSPGRKMDMSAAEAQARINAATADLDEDDLADFNAMLAEEAAKHN
jgi:hypothetical protein